MKHKVAELEGPLLDAAVAKADGWSHQEVEAMIAHGPDGPDQIRYLAASTSWALGGPIIERELVEVTLAERGGWFACVPRAETFHVGGFGPAPLIAAMRAYTASVFGDEVELP